MGRVDNSPFMTRWADRRRIFGFLLFVNPRSSPVTRKNASTSSAVSSVSQKRFLKLTRDAEAFCSGPTLLAELFVLWRPLPRPVILIVFALAAADAQFGPRCRARAVQFCMGIERGLVAPPFEKRQFVGVERALENFELLAAGLFHAFFAAGLHHLRELGALAWCCGDRDDQSYRHFGPLRMMLCGGKGVAAHTALRQASPLLGKLVLPDLFGLNSQQQQDTTGRPW